MSIYEKHINESIIFKRGKEAICRPGYDKWCIPYKSRLREMAVSKEQGWSMLHQEDQRDESWEFHYGKVLKGDQNHHYFYKKFCS